MDQIQTVGGQPLKTITVTSTSDAVKRLPDSIKAQASDNRKSFSVTICIENAPIRFAFQVNPVPGVSPKQVEPNQEIVLTSTAQIAQFRYCNGIAGQNATIHIYPEI